MIKSGIYKICSIQFPERIYIGSSVNIYRRFSVHVRLLKSKKHHSQKLQNHVNKYGISDIFFDFVEKCSANDLLSREQFYIDLIQPFFNINPVAGSRIGSNHSPQSVLKIKKYVLQHKTYKKHPFSGKFIAK